MAHDPLSPDTDVSNASKNSATKPEISSSTANSPSTNIPELGISYGHESQIGIRPAMEVGTLYNNENE